MPLLPLSYFWGVHSWVPTNAGSQTLERAGGPVPDLQGLSAPTAWGRLQELLQQANWQGGASELQLAVVDAALGRDPTIKLPPWLLAAHQVSPQKGQLKVWCLVSSAMFAVPLNGFVQHQTKVGKVWTLAIFFCLYSVHTRAERPLILLRTPSDGCADV